MTYTAVVIPDAFTEGRFVVARKSRVGTYVALCSCVSAAVAEFERRRVQRLYDDLIDARQQVRGQMSFRFFEADDVL